MELATPSSIRSSDTAAWINHDGDLTIAITFSAKEVKDLMASVARADSERKAWVEAHHKKVKKAKR
jgi:hypothetical protein